MSIIEKDSVKAKIKALLDKNIENGASKSEMEKALRLANKLMLENYISEHDLLDPYISENCELIEIPLIKSAYDMSLFYGFLSQLFDCEHYFSSKRIAFFGFKEDIELCSFFYTTIVKSCLYEKDLYIQSSEYNRLKQGFHGKTLVASFIKGFLIEISKKMIEMYENRKSNTPESYGLMIIDKLSRVKEQYENKNLRVRIKKDTGIKGVREAFASGLSKGRDFEIVQGLHTYKQDNTIALKS
jgi:hypothetical protein